jgi:Gpi18-like mannosyltransferase
MLLKWPPIVGDLVLGAIIFYSAPRRYAAVAAAFFLYNPVVWYTSAVWGQTDVFHALFMVLAVLAAGEKKFRRAWALAVLAVFWKLQAVAILPLLLVLHLRSGGWKRLVLEALPAGALSFLLILPFALATSFYTVWRSLFNVIGTYAVVVMYAWNPWYLVQLPAGRWVSDQNPVLGPITYFQIGFFFFCVMTATVIAALPRRPDRTTILAAAALGCFILYLFPTEIHERYLYPLIPFVALIIGEGWVPAAVGAVMTVMIFLGMNMVEPWFPFLRQASLWGRGVPYVLITFAAFLVFNIWYSRRAKAALAVKAD